MSYQSYQSHQQLQQQQQQQQQQQSQQPRPSGNGAWMQPSTQSTYQQRPYLGSATVNPAYSHLSSHAHESSSQNYQSSGLPSMMPYSASSYSQVGGPLYQQPPHPAQPSSASSASSSSSFLPMSGHDSSHLGSSHYNTHGYSGSSSYHTASDDLYHQHAANPVQHHPLDQSHLAGNGGSPGLGLGFPGGLRPKRRQVKNACVNCQKACKKCDEGRPCTRCIKYGLTDTCIDSMRKERKRGIKRGPYKRRATTGSSNAPNTTLPPPVTKGNASFDSYHQSHQAYGIKHEPSSSSSSSGLASSLLGGSSNSSSYDSSSYAMSAPTSYRSAFISAPSSSGLGQQSASPQSINQSPLLYNGREPSRSAWSAADSHSRLNSHADPFYNHGQQPQQPPHSGLSSSLQGSSSSTGGNGIARTGAGSPYFPIPSGLHSTQDGASGSTYLSAFNAGSGAMAQHQRVASETSSSTSASGGVPGGPGSSATNGSSLYSHSISSNSSSSTNGALASPRTPLALESSDLSGVAMNGSSSGRGNGSSYESTSGAQSYAKSPNTQSYGGNSGGAQLPNMATMMRPFSLAMPAFPRSRAHFHQQHHGGTSHQQGDVSGGTAPIVSRV